MGGGGGGAGFLIPTVKRTDTERLQTDEGADRGSEAGGVSWTNEEEFLRTYVTLGQRDKHILDHLFI